MLTNLMLVCNSVRDSVPTCVRTFGVKRRQADKHLLTGDTYFRPCVTTWYETWVCVHVFSLSLAKRAVFWMGGDGEVILLIMFVIFWEQSGQADLCRERHYADHIFIQIYSRVHHFVVKFSKFSLHQAARGHWPLTKILRTFLTPHNYFTAKSIKRWVELSKFSCNQIL